MEMFHRILKTAVEGGASDVHLKIGTPVVFRINRQLVAIECPHPAQDWMNNIVEHITPPHLRQKIDDEREADFSYFVPNIGRFRTNLFQQRGQWCLAMRYVKTHVPSFEELGLLEQIKKISESPRGIVLVAGSTGCGKSTTLAAMIDLINTNYDVKVISVEDPIEFLHTDKRAMISQIEVGTDSASFDQALRQALRQDPDVILVGELRDMETLRMALRAADTGHQVFATVHSSRAAQTVERIIAMFPPAEHKVLLSQLAHSLEAIISQRLVVMRAEGGGRRPAIEILRGGPVTEKYIMEGKLAQLTEFIEGGTSGMQSFDQHLLQMYNERLIAGTEALKHANRPEALATAMRGIKYVSRPGS